MLSAFRVNKYSSCRTTQKPSAILAAVSVVCVDSWPSCRKCEQIFPHSKTTPKRKPRPLSLPHMAFVQMRAPTKNTTKKPCCCQHHRRTKSSPTIVVNGIVCVGVVCVSVVCVSVVGVGVIGIGVVGIGIVSWRHLASLRAQKKKDQNAVGHNSCQCCLPFPSSSAANNTNFVNYSNKAVGIV